ncbi:DUF262 domain-containing protein [Patescibacteria group bacterium]
METQTIKIEGDYKLPDLVHDVGKGNLRIPNFQRHFVWKKPKVIKLLQSMYLQFPIGTFFFWDSPRQYHHFYRDIPILELTKPSRYDRVTFILDGQQRITSIYLAVKGFNLFGKDYHKICFDLDSPVKKGDESEKKAFCRSQP